MRFIIGSDEERPILHIIRSYLESKGHETELLQIAPWGKIALAVAEEVAQKRAKFGVVCCYTGTGVAIAANKVPGVRAALCVDPAAARGARKWNDANVLALSLRATSDVMAAEILDAWLENRYAGGDNESLEAIAEREARRE